MSDPGGEGLPMDNIDQLSQPDGIPQPKLRLIPGVFSFLDAVLSPAQIEEAENLKPEEEQRWAPRCIRGRIADVINWNFRLQLPECPLRKEMSCFRLYHRDDMADALAVAYSMVLRGEDPLTALNADYCLKDYGILTRVDLESLRQRAHEGNSFASNAWGHLRRFHEVGDKVVGYSLVGSSGYLLVRGDRLVWPCETARYCVVGCSLKRDAEFRKFQELGGNRGFLNVDFDWPPEDWVNPVTDEEERASLAQGFRNRT